MNGLIIEIMCKVVLIKNSLVNWMCSGVKWCVI